MRIGYLFFDAILLSILIGSIYYAFKLGQESKNKKKKDQKKKWS